MEQHTFGTKMRTLRTLRGWGQADLQEATGIDSRYISEMENGKILPNPGWESRIKAALGWHEFTDLGLAIIAAEEFPPVAAQMLRELEPVLLGKREGVV